MSRIQKNKWNIEEAISTPKIVTHIRKISYKTIWKRLQKEGRFEFGYWTFTGYIEKWKIDLLDVATVDEISGLKFYKQYNINE